MTARLTDEEGERGIEGLEPNVGPAERESWGEWPGEGGRGTSVALEKKVELRSWLWWSDERV